MVKRNGLQTRSEHSVRRFESDFRLNHGDRSLMVRHQFVALGMTVRFCPITFHAEWSKGNSLVSYASVPSSNLGSAILGG